MKAIKGKDTSIELILRKALFKEGLRYRIHHKKLPGKPDIVFVNKKVAIFCDSEFWHGGNDWEPKKNKIKSNRDYWIPKIERNIQRDKEVNRELKKLGWRVFRYWEKDIRADINKIVDDILKNLNLRAKIRISKPPYFSLKNTVLSNGWANLYPYRWYDGKLAGTFQLKGKAFDFCVSESMKCLFLEIYGDLDGICRRQIVEKFKYAFSFDFPVNKFITFCSEIDREDLINLAKLGWGRLLRGFSPWEDAVKTLLTTNCTWSNTKKMTEKFCKNLGGRTLKQNYIFPSPKSVVEHADLLDKLGLGYRAEYLFSLAERICSEEVILENCLAGNGNSFEESSKTIYSLLGFGNYATEHLLVLYGWYRSLPIDREVMKYLGIKPNKRGNPPKSTNHYSEFSDFRFTAYKLERIRNRLNWIGD